MTNEEEIQQQLEQFKEDLQAALTYMLTGERIPQTDAGMELLVATVKTEFDKLAPDDIRRRVKFQIVEPDLTTEEGRKMAFEYRYHRKAYPIEIILMEEFVEINVEVEE